jgi:adenosine deaminase CECR1
MPKGGNLHIHTSATYNATKFVSMLRTNQRVVVYLGKESSTFKPYQLFLIQDSSLVNETKGFYYLNNAIDRGLLTEQTLISMLSMSDDRIDKVNYIWDEFNDIFARVSPIMKTKTVFRQYYREALIALVQDKIDYAEIRFGPSVLTDNNDALLRENIACENILIGAFPPKENTESIEIFRQEYYRIVESVPHFKVKLILSGSRKKNKDESEEEAVKDAIEEMEKTRLWKAKIKDERSSGNPVEFIIGYDLVSEEDRGYRTEAYAKAIYENNIDIPFYFHDGESNWADCDNLYAAFLLGTKRVGHGIKP